MIFNSIAFAIFLPVVFLLYWFVVNKNLKYQNVFLLLASYFFYAYWDWRFLFLLISVSTINYFIGLRIDKDETSKIRSVWLGLGLLVNLGVLCVFKYYNFFIDSFIDLISLFGYNLSRSTTRIILPLGISFYTFLSLSYIIDIFKKNLKAHRNIINVLLTLSFFPIIMAGPIQRPSTLLPQISSRRIFDYDRAVDGLRQILWGLFAKVVVADNLASYVDDIFKNFSGHSGSTLLFGVIFYSIQIYADFSGYSNIAIGIGKIFGFNLMQNFNYPYFSRDIIEFWKRWHISMTTFFRDYLFLPLSFSISWNITRERVIMIKTDMFIYIIASIITWFLTGLWHGAAYTFIMWGTIHGFFLILYQVQRKPRKKLLKKIGVSNDHIIIVIAETMLTLSIVMLAWVFFRAESLDHAFKYLSKLFSPTIFTAPEIGLKPMVGIGFLIVIEWLQRGKKHALELNAIPLPQVARWFLYIVLFYAVVYYMGNQQDFIYFQF